MSYLKATAIAFLLAATPVAAIDLPANFHRDTEIDSKQFGYTDVSIAKDGIVSVSTKFSNGKRYDGDHFVAQIVVYGPDKIPLLALKHGAGINATGGFGSANEAVVKVKGKIAPDMVDDIVSVGVRHYAVSHVDDEEVWEAARKLVEAIFASSSGDGGSDAAASSSARIDGKAIHYRLNSAPGRALSYSELGIGALPLAVNRARRTTIAGGASSPLGGRLYHRH